MSSASDHQFAFTIGSRSADQWVVRQNIDRMNDFHDAGGAIDDLILRLVCKDAIEVLGNFRCKFYLRHG